MQRIKGIYDGTKVILTEPVNLQPNTAVEVVVADPSITPEQAYWQRLLDTGLIKKVQRAPINEQSVFTSVKVTGKPVSETIIEERR
jgi:hypothetical protein